MMRKGKNYSLKVISTFLLDILKMSKATDFFRLIQPNSNEIIITRDVEFDKNLLAYELNSTFLSSLSYEPSLVFVPSFVPILVSSSYDDSEDENSPSPTYLPPDDPIEHEPALAPPFPRWVHSTQEAVGDHSIDTTYQCWTCSQL
jgi:hypothetical protein